MESEKIKEILKYHKKWINESPDGIKANLIEANLIEADLRWADFRGADLSGANLIGADLRWADFRGADFRGADLRDADLSVANLSGANLIEADLRGADFRGADLSGADLSGANLIGADLRWADFRWADFRGADLRKADLSVANLSGADLRWAKISYPIACPEKGSFIGFKKSVEGYIVEIEITEDAKRSSATTRKCRCSKAKVLEISTLSGESKSEARSQHDKKFVYRVGEIVEVKDFDENRWNECSTGIHFFITRQEAIDY